MAWNTRQALENGAQGIDPSAVPAYAEQVHRWGFGNKPIADHVRAAAEWPTAIHDLARTWSAAVDPIATSEALHALRRLLEIRGVGLATATKWTCFLDQSRFAIYDSRVAYALRRLTIDDRRVFPFVGGRETTRTRGQVVYADGCVSRPSRAVTAYVNYLLVVRKAALLLNERTGTDEWTPARVECGLFMAGQNRLREPGIQPLHQQINRSYQ